MTSIFISRELTPHSLFYQRMTAAGVGVTGCSLIDFTAAPFDELPAVDWIFFYSKRAVRYFFDGLNTLGEPLADEVRLAAIGASTAAALLRYGRSCAFTGTGEPASTAEAFGEMARGERVLFPRARESRRSVQELLGDVIVALDLVVYDNHPAGTVPEDNFDVLVFTSPLNAQAYFARRSFRPGQRIVAIGPTTEAALRQLGIRTVETAARPSEESLAEVVLAGLSKQ